jgi:hypothetical protein
VLDLVVDDDGAPGSAASLLPPAPPQRRDAAQPPGAQPSAPPGGHGLLGMHERASALGGVCRTGARAGGGFRVHVTLPLPGPPRSRRLPPPAQEAAG